MDVMNPSYCCSVGLMEPPTPNWSLHLMGIMMQGTYRYMQDLCQPEACPPTRRPVRWPPCPSPLNLSCFAQHLRPVVAVLAYIAVRPPFQGPLLCIYRDGSPLTRFDLVTSIRHALSGSGLPLDSFTGHSFRIGAATSAALAGLPDSLIQTLGHWRSSAFRVYIRTPVSTLAAVPHTLVSQMSERVLLPANTLHPTPH